VGLALVGVFVPGMPTTVFLIAASYLFTRSCPVLEERLIRNRWFRPYLRYLDGRCPVPRRARWFALGAMWTAVTASLVLKAAGGSLGPVFAATLVGLALIGSAAILRYRRGAVTRSESSSSRPPSR
jgi:uncharacterized membrane protein YbaN (DUF454 family)